MTEVEQTALKKLQDSLRGKLFLSSMMCRTDGLFCSERGRGAAMVQLGAYLAEPPAYGVLEEGCILPPRREDCVEFLAREVRLVKERLSDVKVCLNLATVKVEWGLEAGRCFAEAGGDLLELNFHGGYRRYLEQGGLRAMVLPEHRSRLFRWIEEFLTLEIPLIVKFRMGVIRDYSPILDRLEGLEVFGVHFNVRDDSTGKPCFSFVEDLKSRYRGIFLLASGYVRSAGDAEKLFKSGADMVGVAEPTIDNPRFIAELACKLGLAG